MSVRVHLGCGSRELPGYVHVDLSDYPHIDHRHDIRSLPMFADRSVDLLYASHVLEYFDRVEVGPVLAEWRRVLAPGGTLRLAVPDFAALCTLYGQTGELSRVLGPLYGRWKAGPQTVLYHRTTYDFASLQEMLEQSGFHAVQRWDWREVFTGPLAGFDDYSQAYYPHMDKENGLLISLNVQARRPAGEKDTRA